MRVLELFSGTHSVGKVCKKLGYDVVSLDRDLDGNCPIGTGYKSEKHIKEDIMTWDYKKHYKPGDFDVITASPVCVYWSHLRCCWIGRKCKTIHPTEVITKEIIQSDIDKCGKPMVDKVFEIIDYFQPSYYWIENPKNGKMKTYIIDKPFYDVDYCKYSDWGYRKRTRFWTNIENFEPKLCKLDCENIENNQHKSVLANGYEIIDGKKVLCNTKEKREELRKSKKKHKQRITGISNWNGTLERYRIPEKLIEELINCIIKNGGLCSNNHRGCNSCGEERSL